MLIKVCQQCSKHFNTFLLRSKFCSHSCYVTYKREHPKPKDSHICFVCHKIFYRPNSQVTGKVSLCSNPCRHKHKSTLTPPSHIENSTILESLKKAFVINDKPYMMAVEYCAIRKREKLPSEPVIYRRFHSWKSALENADLPSTPPINPLTCFEKLDTPPSIKRQRKDRIPCTKEQVLEDLLSVATIIGQTPTCVQYNKLGKYTWHIVAKALTGRNDKWADACVAAGLLPHTTHEGNGDGKSFSYLTPSGNTVTLQSSYEFRFAEVLNKFGLFWLCHRELDSPIVFTNPKGRTGYYRPDFYIPSKNIYLDTKGWYRPKDKGKMRIIHACNPYKDIRLVFKYALALSEKSDSFDSWLEEATKLNLLG